MIIVTGGSGKAGRACISELLAHNYEVASVDLVRDPDSSVAFSRVELTDFGQTMSAFSQVDDRIRNVSWIGAECCNFRHEHHQYLQCV
jgi:nucleoside-diphosphate-sugar epimerase